MNSDGKTPQEADFVFQNGAVYTVDQQRSLTEAVAVKGRDHARGFTLYPRRSGPQ